VLLPLLVATVACPSIPIRVEPRRERSRYVLDVRIARPFRSVSGDVTVTFTPTQPTDHLVFRLWPNGPAQLRAGSRLVAGPVTSAGAALQVARPDPTTLTVRLGRTLAPGAHVTVHVPWRLRIPSTHNDRIARFRDGVRLGTFFPLLAWDARRGWLTDPPTRILAESAATPAADFDVRVHAPRGLRILATGSEVGRGHFRARAVRDVALAVGPFRVSSAPGRVKVRVAFTGSSGVASTALALAGAALQELSKRYGAYPWSSYTLVFPPDLPPSGIEYPTLSFIGGRRYLPLLIDHETAHQWFYSLVGNNQARDPWLDETLATWAQERLGAREPPTRGAPPAGATRHVGAPMSYWDRQGGWYNYGVYGAGVAALHSLGNDAAVDCAVRRYVARRAYAIAQPGDLLDELNRVIPGAERRLRAWGIRR